MGICQLINYLHKIWQFNLDDVVIIIEKKQYTIFSFVTCYQIKFDPNWSSLQIVLTIGKTYFLYLEFGWGYINPGNSANRN